MRTWIIPILGLLLGGCSLPVAGETAVPLTWMGDFNRGPAARGHITVLFDEVGASVSGTMFFESTEADGAMPRVTYRIEGTQEDGAIHFEQKEILQADPLTNGHWCLGSYDLSLGALDEAPARADGAGAQALSGAYSSEQDCGGSTTLQPAETL
jgi:hypothetical protein